MALATKDVVAKHIDHWDPMALFPLGVPDDEYETEIDAITELFNHYSDHVVIAEEIQHILQEAFQKCFPFETCLTVTQAIWNELFE